MRFGKIILRVMVFLALSGAAPIASAHLPTFDDGTAVDADHAFYWAG